MVEITKFDGVELLLEKAYEARTGLEAMQFSQAALNAANAILLYKDAGRFHKYGGGTRPNIVPTK